MKKLLIVSMLTIFAGAIKASESTELSDIRDSAVLAKHITEEVSGMDEGSTYTITTNNAYLCVQHVENQQNSYQVSAKWGNGSGTNFSGQFVNLTNYPDIKTFFEENGQFSTLNLNGGGFSFTVKGDVLDKALAIKIKKAFPHLN